MLGKFTEMVINPMFAALKAIFDDFLGFKKKWEKRSNLTIPQMDFLIATRQKCMELLKDIRYNKYTQQILKVVAPKYDFDTYKKSVDLKKEKTDKVKINKKVIDDDSDDEILVKKRK